MAERKLRCEIMTPEKIVFKGDVDMIVAPGSAGELGILPLHMPIITTLTLGEISIRHNEAQTDYVAIDSGYMEAREDKVTILADAAQLASQMDIDSLDQMKSAIEAKMSELPRDSE